MIKQHMHLTESGPAEIMRGRACDIPFSFRILNFVTRPSVAKLQPALLICPQQTRPLRIDPPTT